MLPSAGNRFAWKYTNYDTPSGTPGASVTPGASNAEGSWTPVASAANIARDVWTILLWISGGTTSTASKCHLLDIGVDPAGGSSYVAKISNIVCGGSNAGGTGGRFFLFPFRIKAGSSVAVRIQGNASTAGTVYVAIKFLGAPSTPEMTMAGPYSETIGAITGSNGVSFTPGNSGRKDPGSPWGRRRATYGGGNSAYNAITGRSRTWPTGSTWLMATGPTST